MCIRHIWFVDYCYRNHHDHYQFASQASGLFGPSPPGLENHGARGGLRTAESAQQAHRLTMCNFNPSIPGPGLPNTTNTNRNTTNTNRL